MLLRRLRREAARQNWLGVGLDLFILVLGVFLGMQVSNWNAERLDKNKGQVYRERLAADFEANLRDLENRQVYYSVTRDHAQAALDALDRPVGENPAKFLVDAYQASQIAPRKLGVSPTTKLFPPAMSRSWAMRGYAIALLIIILMRRRWR